MVLDHGRDIDLKHGNIWVERAQRNATIGIYGIGKKWKLAELAENACEYGVVVDLDVAVVGGSRTLFVEYDSRLDAERAKIGMPITLDRQSQKKINGVWVDSKILNNSLRIQFNSQDNESKGKVINESSVSKIFALYGSVRRVEFIRNQWNINIGEFCIKIHEQLIILND
ncbi:MAG: hypothetical protein EZS28_037514 [Streblomastix strix]|uniref:RRM domain-containing protein n=1 Tax=Streblomastix strix TaxID=222440 RepID=A0A5J4U945_9EUKA|nr:MAG: hypothetical protein EZS28_037514 [Streblomastix strix]